MSTKPVLAGQNGSYSFKGSVASQSSWVKATASSAFIAAAGAGLLTGGAIAHGQSQIASPRPFFESSAVATRRYRPSVFASPAATYNDTYAAVTAERLGAEVVQQDDLALEESDMVAYSVEEKKLASAINWSFGGLLALIVLAIAGVPAVVWAPAIFSAVGVLLSCGIQLNRIDSVRAGR